MTIFTPTENNSQLIFIVNSSNLLLTPGLSLIELSQKLKNFIHHYYQKKTKEDMQLS